MTTDGFIKLGFWSQLILLVLVDWGTLVAFSRGAGSTLHYVGFGLVNAVLLFATWMCWRWLKPQKSPHEPPTA